MLFASGISVGSAYFECINMKDIPINCFGNLRHLIVEACIARNLLDTSVNFWPGYMNAIVFPNTNDPLIAQQIIWIRSLAQLLILQDDKHPSSSQVLLHLLIHLEDCAYKNSAFAWEYKNMQYSLYKFYISCQVEGDICYDPFIKLSKDSHEISICCLYYFSNLGPLLLKSLTLSCLCPNLEPFILIQIIEVLHSSFNAHLKTADATNKQLLALMDAINFLKPKFVLMENVVDPENFAKGYLE